MSIATEEAYSMADEQIRKNTMKSKLIITDPMHVKIGDKAYFKNCDFGFAVLDVDRYDVYCTLKVNIPISEDGFWSDSTLFDHATREVEEQEWPNPNDLRLHIYLGADGKRYLYNPCGEQDTIPWSVEGIFASHTRDDMAFIFPEAFPLTELELVTKVSES